MKQKQSLRLLMLGHKRIPSREGGVEIVVEELSTRMAALGHRVTCYNRSGSHVSGKQMRGLAAMSASIFGAIGAAFGKYDVIHFHAEGSAYFCVPCAG